MSALKRLHCFYNDMPKEKGSGVTGIDDVPAFTEWGQDNFMYSPQGDAYDIARRNDSARLWATAAIVVSPGIAAACVIVYRKRRAKKGRCRRKRRRIPGKTERRIAVRMEKQQKGGSFCHTAEGAPGL